LLQAVAAVEQTEQGVVAGAFFKEVSLLFPELRTP
jgi:hypothetical protein